jgi:hypothetical protein
MPDETVALMEVMDVGSQQTGHEPRQVPRIGKLHDEVEMVAHQAVMVKTKADSLLVARQRDRK